MVTMVNYDSSHVSPRERREYWTEAISQTFVPLQCRIVDANTFDSRLNARVIDAISLVDIHVAPQEVVRSQKSIWLDHGDQIIMSLINDGTAGVVQGGREVALNRGEFTLYDTRKPYELQLGSASRQTILQVPRELLSRHLGKIDNLTAVRFGHNHPLGKLTDSFISQIINLPADLPLQQQQLLIGQALDLVTTIIADTACIEGKHYRSAASLLGQVKRLIDEQLADHNLSGALVAHRFGISPRYLGMLFQQEEQTFGRYILTRRLEKCAEALRNPKLSTLPIGEIAYLWGFNEPSHFSREFKRAFGMSPREYRNSTPGGMVMSLRN